ncbi:Arc family DNA binding domain-containing protein [Lutimonas zeaxanthinifaciens]|uniref:Arc family DNA binding domain-containing protein n=1 Tax=Lutimonas zeaxanthinifaciens TaxID=3060215 RepID=UPI00265CEBF4|nr:Arc family DNA binding domain-containing protein [Lutimonas sp. YSD2104]WKK66954.1 Arc family DNA binding domain-containing protein [Lutimonas sp. YSD2104]
MKSKKAFALRIDEELLKAIETLAKEEFRSTNGQIEWMLSKHVKESGRFSNNQNEEGLYS